MVSNSFITSFGFLRHCFIELSNQTYSHSKQSDIALIEWGNRNAYLWAIFKALPGYICRLDKKFSSCIGLENADQILVSFPPLYFPDCISLVLVPVSIFDWNTLIPVSKQLSLKLLEQQRIVWIDLIIPFWVHTNVCVYLRVVSIDPLSDFVILQKNTEVRFYRDIEQFDENVSKIINTKYSSYYNMVLDKSIDDDFVPSLLILQIFDFIKVHFTAQCYPEREYRMLNVDIFTKVDTFFQNLISSNKFKFIFLFGSQFKTDGYDIILECPSYVYPNEVFFSHCFHRNVSFVIANSSQIYILKHLTKDEIYPLRVHSEIKTESKFSADMTESRSYGIKLRQAIPSECPLKSITIHMLKDDLERYGEYRLRNILKSKLLELSKNSPFPIKNSQILNLQIDSRIISIQFDVGIYDTRVNLKNAYFLIHKTLINDINIIISPSIYLKENICNSLKCILRLNSFPDEDLFFGYNSLKLKAKRIINSFFSHFNQINNTLCMLITSHCPMPKMGRKSFVSYILHLASKLNPNMSVKIIDGILLKGKKIELIKTSLLSLFDYNTIAIVYNIEQLLPETEEDHDIFKRNFSLFHFLSSLIMKNYRKINKFLFLSTSRNNQLIHSCPTHQGNHFFNYQFVIPPPSFQDKLGIFQGTFKVNKVFLENNIKYENLILLYPKLKPGDFNFILQRVIQDILLQNSGIHDLKISQDLINLGFEKCMSNGAFKDDPFTFPITEKELADDIVQFEINENLVFQLKYPILISKLPIMLKFGVLLYGMPGTGKTFLAEKIAKLNKLELLKIRGPELLNKYVGSSEENIRRVFSTARSYAPCIILFDEFDSFARSRGFDKTGVLDRVVNQLLTEIDGVNQLEGVSIIATTCHPELIDPALLRPGRLGCHLKCIMPDHSKRKIILESLIDKHNFKIHSLDLKIISELTERYSCADLKALIANCIHDFLYNINPNSSLEAITPIAQKFLTLQVLTSTLKTTDPSISEKEYLFFDMVYKEFENSSFSSNFDRIKEIFA